jgi:hypothetical protein
MSKPKLPSLTAALSRVALMILLDCAARGHSQQGEPGSLPVTHGKTLSGTAVSFPKPDQAETLIIAGFSKNSSTAVKDGRGALLA